MSAALIALFASFVLLLVLGVPIAFGIGVADLFPPSKARVPGSFFSMASTVNKIMKIPLTGTTAYITPIGQRRAVES